MNDPQKSQIWEESIGGKTGSEFREALKRGVLEEFVKKYPKESQKLLESHQAFVGTPHSQLSQAISGKPVLEKAPQKSALSIPSSGLTIRLTAILVSVLVTISGLLINLQLKKNATNRNQEVAGVAKSEPALSPLENKSLGYKFLYPENMNVYSIGDSVEIFPPDGHGKVIVTYKNQRPEVDIDTTGATRADVDLLNLTVSKVRETFQSTEAEKYNRQSVEKRFEQ